MLLMTTATRTRCHHCQQSYIYHPSFYGGDEVNYPYNNDRYCEGCYKVVQAALSKVPVKCEKKFVPSDRYTREQIVAHQEERCANGLSMRRIFPTLIDTTGKDRHNIVCECMPDNEWYMAEWWSSDPDKVAISKETWCSKD